METFRCPTCIGVLPDARANRCPNCGQNIRRRPPKVLGEDTRIGATNLPIDRWMLDRLHNDGRGRHALPPVAWHGKFTTSPLAEPDFSATPVPTATPLAPPSTVVLAGEPETTRAWQRALEQVLRPDVLTVDLAGADVPERLRKGPAPGAGAAAWVCRGMRCLPPLTAYEAIPGALAEP